MATQYYIERAAAGRRHYDLQGRVLKISRTQGFGRFKTDVDLADIAPHFQRSKCFNRGAINRATLYLVAIAVLGSLFRHQSVVPPIVVLLATIFVALPGIIVLFRFSRQIEIEVFRSHAGIVIFDLIREKQQAAEFDAYVEVLRAAVLAAQYKREPNQSAQTTPGLRPSVSDL